MHALLAVVVTLAAEPLPPPLTSANPLEPLPYPVEREPEPIPSSFSIYVSFLEPSFAVFTVGGGGSPVGVTNASATFRLGGVFGGRHALLVGLSFAAFLGLSTSSATSLALTLAPAYRIHFKPLTPGGLSPFLQIEGIIGTVLASGPAGGGLPLVLGFGPGLGAEYLFSRSFGIAATIGGRLTFLTYAGLAVVGLSLWSSVAVALHF